MYKSDVFKSWALVLQLGISMLVPIFLLVAAGIFIKSKFNIDLMVWFVVLGVVVGVRNVYVIIDNYLKSISHEKKESELLTKHMKGLKK